MGVGQSCARNHAIFICTTMEEVWKDVVSFEGYYQVSNLGKVKSLSRYVNTYNGKRLIKGKIRRPQKHNQGYLTVSFSGVSSKLIHRIVAQAFIPNPLNLEFVNHINGIKTDNRVENLEWVTRQQNEDHAFGTGLKNSTGSHNQMAKLDEEKVRLIKQSKGILKSRELALVYQVHEATITRIWKGTIWKHV